MFLWVKVTADEYELPVAVADTATELARMLGTTRNCISSSLCHGSKTIKKIWIDESIGDECERE